MTKTIPLLQLTLVLGLALGTAGCETVSDAADGVGNAVSNVADGVGSAVSSINPFSDDEADSVEAPPTASADAGVATTPDLANLPSRPATSTPGQQQAAAQSLAADGAQARYSADALRAGTETAAAPPPSADVPPSAVAAAGPADDAPPSAFDAPPSAQPSAPPPVQAAAAGPSGAAVPPSLSQGTEAIGARPGAAPVQTAALAPSRAAIPAGAEPAVPAVPPNTPVRGAAAMGSRTVSDAALGFKPSAAPPLDPSINKWVPAPIVARYRQTASNAGISAMSSAAVPGAGSADVIPAGASSYAAMTGGVPPTAVVYFPGDGTTLSSAARAQINAAVAEYKAGGGSVRVVGHASSRTANMPVERHLQVTFDKSQARANAVAQALIRAGIPADKVLIEAVGDSQPVYYESMPRGEDGNRRAEIFVQS